MDVASTAATQNKANRKHVNLSLQPEGQMAQIWWLTMAANSGQTDVCVRPLDGSTTVPSTVTQLSFSFKSKKKVR